MPHSTHTHTHTAFRAHTHTHEHTRTLKCFCCLLLREVFHFSFCVDFSTNFRGEKRRVLMHHFLLGYCTVIILCGMPAKERHFSRSRSLSASPLRFSDLPARSSLSRTAFSPTCSRKTAMCKTPGMRFENCVVSLTQFSRKCAWNGAEE